MPVLSCPPLPSPPLPAVWANLGTFLPNASWVPDSPLPCQSPKGTPLHTSTPLLRIRANSTPSLPSATIILRLLCYHYNSRHYSTGPTQHNATQLYAVAVLCNRLVPFLDRTLSTTCLGCQSYVQTGTYCAVPLAARSHQGRLTLATARL